MTTTVAALVHIARSEYEARLTAAGLTWTEQSGYLKVEPVANRRIYVASTKTVRRIDISGFEATHDIAREPKGGRFGRVNQQMHMEGTADEVLARFDALLEVLKAQTPDLPVPKAKAPKAPKAAAPEAEGEVPEAPTSSPADRLELIKRVAAEKGVAVSSRTLALADQA